jgi:hypothetical protein
MMCRFNPTIISGNRCKFSLLEASSFINVLVNLKPILFEGMLLAGSVKENSSWVKPNWKLKTQKSKVSTRFMNCSRFNE